MMMYSCEEDEVLVVSGVCVSRPKYIIGGTVFVWPGIQLLQRMNIKPMTLTIDTPKVKTHQGSKISVTSVVQVAVITQSIECLQCACENFLGKPERTIEQVAQDLCEGAQKAIICQMNIEEIFENREKFQSAMFTMAAPELINFGLGIPGSAESWKVKALWDDEGYLQSVGNARSEKIKEMTTKRVENGQQDVRVKVLELLKEYFSSGNVAQATVEFKKLDIPELHHYMVYEATLLVLLDESIKSAEMMCDLLKSLMVSNIVNTEQINQGLQQVIDSLQIITQDIPSAHPRMERFISLCHDSGLCSNHLILEMKQIGHLNHIILEGLEPE